MALAIGWQPMVHVRRRTEGGNRRVQKFAVK